MCDEIGILSRGVIVRKGSVRELCGSAGAWRLRFESGTEGGLAELGFERRADGSYRVLAATAAELDRWLGVARQSGALLIQLEPDARDLEDVLSEALA